MSVLDMLARAEVSSDLQHHEKPCDVDTLGAAGMAASHNHAHMALFRLKYLNDATEIDSAKRLFIMWARRAMINRGMDATGTEGMPGKPKTPSANRVGSQALTSWISDVCPACNGVKYQAITGTPNLSDRQCGPCKGTGRNQVTGHGPLREVVSDLHERADNAVYVIRHGIDEKLGRD